MIHLCPYCGHSLPECLKDGICFCPTCNHDVDSSQKNKIMSGAWMCFRQKARDMEGIRKALGLTVGQAIMIEAFLIFNEYSMEEFRNEMMDLGVIS